MQSPPDLRTRKDAPRRINASVSKQVLLTACENGTVSQFPSQRNRRRSSQRARVSDEFQFSLGARSCLRVHNIQSSVPDGLTYRNARRRRAAMIPE
jgi:hypothetical protein